ncbi:MAG TPA: hypothetical protein VNG29_02175 [Candidatus Paceibacterota bacterium]|nr:hypothetical protein [Candidatus Paceibacterota bacterium]
MNNYAIRTNDCTVACGVFGGMLLRDEFAKSGRWEDFGEQDLDAYFNGGYATLLSRLEAFRDLPRPLTAEENKELRFMLEALIEAKRVLTNAVN